MPVPQAHRQKSGGGKRRQRTISQNLALPLSLGQGPPCQGPLRRQNPLHANRRPNHRMGTRETNIIRRLVPDRANYTQRHPDRSPGGPLEGRFNSNIQSKIENSQSKLTHPTAPTPPSLCSHRQENARSIQFPNPLTYVGAGADTMTLCTGWQTQPPTSRHL